MINIRKNKTINAIYHARYFWIYLVFSDLKSRFRRTKLGLLWLIIQPFVLTIIISVVFSVVFRQKLGDYAAYILSGVIVWNLISGSVIGAGSCFLASAQYIHQFNHPIIIYSLRYVILNIITFLIELLALILWMSVLQPRNFIFGLLTLPLTTLLYFGLFYPISTIAGYLNAKYRDYPQVMALLMQTIWYISPVFFKQEMFMGNYILEWIFKYNPITHILSLVREPFVNGRMPSVWNYLFVILTIVFISLIAQKINRDNKNKIIFYLN